MKWAFFIPVIFCLHRGYVSHVRQRIRDLVHKHRYQIAVIVLVLLDAAIVIATIIVDDVGGGGI